MASSTINPLIPVANSSLASTPIRSQFQAAANDINTIYGLINAYPAVVQLSPNVYVGSNGQLSRSAFGIPISITQVWNVLAHDGVSEFYSTPIYYPNFVSAAYTGPAIIFQGFDWFVYVVNALTGVAIAGFPVATTGPCYGRCQAANIDTGGYAGMTVVFAATHGNQSGQTGSIYAFHSDGTQLWNTLNVYQLEGGNDGILNGSVIGGSTAVGLAVASATTSSVTLSGTNPQWPTNAWTRVEGAASDASAYITAGTGAGTSAVITGVTGGNTLTITGTWSVTPNSTSKIQIVPKFTSDVVFQHAGTLNVESGTTYLYVTGDDNTLVKLNALTGAKVWRFWAEENNEPFPLIAPVVDGITPSIMFNSVDGHTYNISLAGSQNWSTLGTSGVGLDSFLSVANISNTGAYLNVVVNQRRSGNSAAGRTYVLRGDTGAKVSESGDQLGDNSSGPLLIPRADGSEKYNIFTVGNACLATLYDDQMNGLWRRRYADNSGIDQFRSSPILADMNYDGVNEIVSCMQNTGTIMVWSLSGVELAELTLPCQLNATDCGVEGTPTQFVSNGVLYLVIPSKDGHMFCYQVNQNAG
jgi:hypothetical protein